MKPLSLHRKIVPTTMVVIALLFTEKAIGLAREATAKDAAQSEAVGTPPALPSPQPLAGTAAVGSAAAGPAVSPGEVELLRDLRKRRQALDEREHSLDQRDELLRSAQAKLEARLGELTVLQKQLERLEDERHARDSQNWTGLVKMYEDMKPKDAAEIFNVLDMHVLLEVLDRMQDRKAAAVVADMVPERARIVTQMLAQKRTHQDAVPAAPAVEQHG